MHNASSLRVERTIAALIAAFDLAPRLAALYDAHPYLGVSGFEVRAPAQRPDASDVRRCLYWLADDVRRLQYVESSYGLKHIVERWLREQEPNENAYTPNGAMIAALFLAGWPVRRRGPNARIVRAAAA